MDKNNSQGHSPSQANGDTVTVPLTLPVGLYRQTLAMSADDGMDGFDAGVIHSLEGDVEAWLESGTLNHRPRRILRQYERELDAGKHPEVWPPRLVSPAAVASPAASLAAFGWLDDHACQLIGERLDQEPRLDLRDLLNSAVDFLLSDPETHPEADEPRKCLHRAYQRRVHPDPSQPPPSSPSAPATHLLTLCLSEAQLGMLGQTARYDGEGVEAWALGELYKVVELTLRECYGHQGDRIAHGWQPLGPKPPRRAVVDEAARYEAAKQRHRAERAEPAPTVSRLASRITHHAGGAMDLTLHLAPPVARMIQVLCDMQEEETTPAQLIYENLADFVAEYISQGQQPERANLQSIINDHAPTSEEEASEDGPLFLRLDEEAAEKLRVYRRLTGRELEDIASGAVVSDVGHALDWQHARQEPDWYSLAEEVEEAAARRLEAGLLHGGPGCERPTTADTAPPSALARDFALEPFFLKLFDAFCGRWDIEPAAFVRAAVQEKLENIFSTQGEEYLSARDLRESGSFHGKAVAELTEEGKVRLYVQAGLDIGDLVPPERLRPFGRQQEQPEEEKTAIDLTTREGEYIDTMHLSSAAIALIEDHARRHAMDFQEAFGDVIRIGLDTREVLAANAEEEDLDAPFDVVDLRDRPATDRADVALAAAGKVPPIVPPADDPPLSVEQEATEASNEPVDDNRNGDDENTQPEGGK